MNKPVHEAVDRSKSQHGTENSYIIGFILSLIFTAIPYWLVTQEVVAGNVLLAIILFFAVLQMLVQLLFFLHLGRERKPRWQLYFFAGTGIGILTVVVGTIFIMNHLHYNMSPADVSLKLAEGEGIARVGGAKTGACQGRQEQHKVVIKDGAANPSIVIAKLCDTITFVNEDEGVRELTFGSQPQTKTYGGENLVTVRNGRPESITLNQTGTHQYYDRLKPETGGYFTVSNGNEKY